MFCSTLIGRVVAIHDYTKCKRFVQQKSGVLICDDPACSRDAGVMFAMPVTLDIAEVEVGRRRL